MYAVASEFAIFYANALAFSCLPMNFDGTHSTSSTSGAVFSATAQDENQDDDLSDIGMSQFIDEIEHDFEVMEGGDDKTMVCELRAKKGEVWFDPDSLRIVRK